jgi:predicted MFS family arabinose efflux permease
MRDRKQVFMFFAVSFLFYMAANFAHPVTPTIIKHRGFGDYIFGVALASMMTANFLVSPFWGKAITVFSSRKTLMICSFGYAIGQLMFGLAKAETMILAARVFAGAFTGGLFTACLTYVVNTSPEDVRGSYLTASATLHLVGGSFGYFIGGMLGEIHENVAVGVQVVTLMVVGVLFYLVCEDDSIQDMPNVGRESFFREANPLAAFIAARHIMTPLFIAIFAVSALSNLGGIAFDQSLNYYMKAQLGFSSGYNGVIKAITGFVALLVNSTIGIRLINNSDARKSSIWVYSLCSIAMAAIVLLNSIVPLGIVVVVYFGLYAVSVPLTQSIVADKSSGYDSNLVMGCYNGLRSLGGIFGALASGLLYTVNPKGPFVLAFVAFSLTTAASVHYYSASVREDFEVQNGADD